ncbi:MAG: DUF4926 domain-containing protein [Peptococcaceae bacterium]|nr:DUF4926 domain-containing protein [Peptococcaceae bacterium]
MDIGRRFENAGDAGIWGTDKGYYMKPYQKVRLMTDKYIDEGIKKGDIGVILEDYDGNNFEVEFSDPNGITIALFAFPIEELELAE